MRCVWQKKICTVRDVQDFLNKDREIAYNTVQTIMTRLVDKELLKRSLQGKKHVYQPKQRKKKILKSAIKQSMRGFMDQFGEDAVVAFLDGLDDISEETRQKLIKKLQKE